VFPIYQLNQLEFNGGMAGLQQEKKDQPIKLERCRHSVPKKKKKDKIKNAIIPKTLPTSASAENNSYLRGFENVCCVF
jgi:hypothetical protein